MNPGESTMSTITILSLVVVGCIIINVFLYLSQDIWIGGLFTALLVVAIGLTYRYNEVFNLNITNYSISTLLQTYFVPILTYITWVGVFYWLIKASYDIKENPDKSKFSLISAAALTILLPILVGIFTAYRDQSTGKKILYGLFATFVLFIGIYSYYIDTLRNGCNNRIDNTICWTYAAHITFACFISLTAFFIWLSTKNVSKYFQLLPSSLLIDPKLPLSIFSVVIYLLCWISWVIVFFRNSKISDFVQDEIDDVVNRTFTFIGLLTLILLFIKQNETGTELINMIVEFIRLPVSTILLHVSILTIFIISLNSSITYIQQKNNVHSTEVNNIIYVLFGILCLFFVSYLFAIFSSIKKNYSWKWVIIFFVILIFILFEVYYNYILSI
jgi:hypothetical protein